MPGNSRRSQGANAARALLCSVIEMHSRPCLTGRSSDGQLVELVLVTSPRADDIAPRRGLALVGPAGIGKTTLAPNLVADLEPTHRVLVVRGSRSALDVGLGEYEAVLPPSVQQTRAA